MSEDAPGEMPGLLQLWEDPAFLEPALLWKHLTLTVEEEGDLAHSRKGLSEIWSEPSPRAQLLS